MALDDFPSEAELAADPMTPGASPDGVANPGQGEDLFDFPVIVAFGEEPHVVGARSESRGMILDSNESQSLREGDDLLDGSALERAIDQATHSVSDLLSAKTLPPPPAAAGPAEPGISRLAAAHPPASAPRVAPAAGPSATIRGDARPMWVLAAAALLLNLGLFAFLWQTSRAFQATLLEVRAERGQPIVMPPIVLDPARLDPGAGATTGLSTGTPTGPTQQAPMPFEAPEETALRLAREELAAGRPQDARRRLFELLARVDQVERTRREHIEAQAVFLVARSFRAQSLLLAEERP